MFGSDAIRPGNLLFGIRCGACIGGQDGREAPGSGSNARAYGLHSWAEASEPGHRAPPGAKPVTSGVKQSSNDRFRCMLCALAAPEPPN